jgi:hypothetical protein
MAVMAREAADERLDDLNTRMEKGFDRVDADVRELRSEIHAQREENKAGFERVDGEFGNVRSEMRAGFAEVNGRIDALRRTIVVCFSGMTAGIVGALLVTLL